jgi:hypothetical protein
MHQEPLNLFASFLGRPILFTAVVLTVVALPNCYVTRRQVKNSCTLPRFERFRI